MNKRLTNRIALLLIIPVLANMVMIGGFVSANGSNSLQNSVINTAVTENSNAKTSEITSEITSGITSGNTSEATSEIAWETVSEKTSEESPEPIKNENKNNTNVPYEYSIQQNGIVLPVIEKKERADSESILKKSTSAETEVLKQVLPKGENEAGVLSKSGMLKSLSSMYIPEDAIYVNENEVKVLNDDNSEKKSNYTLVFTPENTDFYKITASSANIPYIYLIDNNSNTLGWNRTYPEKSDSIAYKLYKGQQYLINLYSVDTESPTEFSVTKYRSNATSLIYSFVDNTYTADENASVVVTIPAIPADKFYGILDRDILISAELYRGDELVDKISEITAQSIRGAMGTPDDNILQFVCEFGKIVEYGEYTIKITCYDNEGNLVIDTCESAIEIGSTTILYAPSQGISFKSNSYSGQQRIYFKDVNTDKGKIIVFDDEKIVGTSANTAIRSTSIQHDSMFSRYSMTNHEYDTSKFVKNLYYADIPDLSFIEPLQVGKEYKLKMVAGVGEFDTDAQIIPTKGLVINNVSYSSLYNSSSNVTVYTEFYNFNSIKPNDISIELIDLRGEVVASQVGYTYDSYYSESDNITYIRYNLRINKPLETNNRYSVKINYPGKFYSNTAVSYIEAYSNGDYLNLKSPTVLDAEKMKISVSTYDCNNKLEYDAVLYRVNGSLSVPISEVRGVKPDDSGTFTIDFPQNNDLPILVSGASYYIEFKYKRPSYNNEIFTSSIGFNMPQSTDVSNISKDVTFYPPVLPEQGEIEFTISGYELENGIMGTDNSKISIELVANNEVYGSVIKDTIKKSASLYDVNSNYSISQIMITGNLQLQKALVDDTQYFIRINGSDYKYFYKSSEPYIDQASLNIQHYCAYSEFKDSLGANCLLYDLSFKEPLNLKYSFIKNAAEDYKLILKDIENKQEIELGKWITEKTYFDGEYKDISIEADLSQVSQDRIFEMYLKAGDSLLSFGKYIKVIKPKEAYFFSVHEAVYGSDKVTLSLPSCYDINSLSFDIKDSFDMVYDCSIIQDSLRRDSNNVLYIDVKTDMPLSYGVYKFRVYGAENTIKYTTLHTVSAQSSIRSIDGVKNGLPYIIYGKGLSDEGVYTADITDYNNITRVRAGIALTKKQGESFLELDEKSLYGLPIGNYSITVNLNESAIGNTYFNYSGPMMLKPLIMAEEWMDSPEKSQFITSDNVELIIKTMYYNKVRFAESLEKLEEMSYQPITDSIDYRFESTGRVKLLYFQFADDNENESEISTFKAYLTSPKNGITVISPEKDEIYDNGLSIKASISNNPHSVWLALYWQTMATMAQTAVNSLYSSSNIEYIKLSKEEATDYYSYEIPKDYAGNLIKFEIYSVDEFGNITNSKTVDLKDVKDPEPVTYIQVSDLASAYNKQNITISGSNATPGSNVTIYAYPLNDNGTSTGGSPYRVTVIANEEGKFEGLLNILKDGYYRISIADNMGRSSYTYYRIWIDTAVPVLKNYTTIAQSNNSVRISWDVEDRTNCKYTLWRDGKIIEDQFSDKYYIAAGLTQGKTYTFRVVATDMAGNQSEAAEIVVNVVDKIAPDTPKNLLVSSNTGKSITLSWYPSKDNSYVAGYEIYRDDEKVGISYTTTYTDSNVVKGVEYGYRIKAFDPSMNYSGLSELFVHSIKDLTVKSAYDGSYEVIASTSKTLVLKALTNDILNNTNIRVMFEYSKDNGENWIPITSVSQYTTTPDGLLFSTIWKIEGYDNGDYIIRYTVTDIDGFTSQDVSKPIKIQKTDDIISPTIKSILPNPTCYANSIPLIITAEDNMGVKSITIQDSLDGVDWKDLTTITMSYVNKTATANYTVDVSNIREGEYYIRAIATDTSGNSSNSTGSASFNQYIIDRTPPQKVEDVTVSSTLDYIELKWGMNSEPYIKGFNVLRAESIDGEYITLAANTNTLNFIDQNAKKGVTYYYKVSCSDLAGNTGEYSDPVQATILVIDDITDDLPPEITSIYPNNNAVIGNKLYLAVTAMDNIRLSKIGVQFKTGENDWTDLKVIDTAYSSDGFSAQLDTSKYPAGTVIKVRAYAVDAKGNKSSFEYADYTIDNVPPKNPVIDVAARNMGIYVSWSCEDEDINSYKVYRRMWDSSFYTLIGEYSITVNNVLDANLDPSYQYIYKVIAVDGLGNTSFSESRAISPLDVDDILPNAVINSISSAEIGTVVEFDSTPSFDNVKIAKYEWDFGDGKTMEGSKVKHQFNDVGTYNVVLTVTDTSGNQGLATRTVTIVKKGLVGTVEVSVIDDQGNKLPYTDVYVNLGEDDQYKSTSDLAGKLSLNMEPGRYKIGAYKSGYAPSHQEVLVIEGKINNLKLVLRKSEVVIGSMTATKMTLDEIKKAGIDVTAPGNQNVFKYQINLVYQNKPYKITHIEKTSGGTNISTASIGDRTVYISTVPRSGSSSGNSGSAPVTVLLDVPGGTSWLKDFFDVKLHLVNTQGEYDIENCVVNLNIPSGLSIAGGSAKTTEIGTLPANGSKVLNWIIRGDKPGSYNISADFSGILESFNETISARFAPSESINVEDSSRLKLIIEVEEVKYSNDKLLYRVGFMNERNTDLYRPKISMQDSDYIRSYKTNTNMALINTSHEVLKPGEILWSEYSIDPAKFEGDRNVGLRLTDYASKALGGMKIPIEIRPVEYGTFGRVKPSIYVIDPHTGRETEIDSIDLIRYRSRQNDVMPDLKIKTGRGISKDVVVKEACDLTIDDGLFGVTHEITTDKNGEYIYKGGSIDAVELNDSGKGYFSIKVTSDTKISDTLRIRVLDQNLLSSTEFGSVSGKVWNKDERKPVSGATVIIGSNTRTTDVNGMFSFNDIMFDGNTITVKAAGFPEKIIESVLFDGKYITVNLSKVPEITRVVSWCSDSTNSRSSIVPMNLMGSSIDFRIDTDLKGNGEVTEYLFKIVDKNGNEKYSGSETDKMVTIWNIKNKMAIGDRLKFAIKTSGPYGNFTSDYVDAKLVMAQELPLLNTVDWLFDRGIIQNEIPIFNPEIEGINDANRFFNSINNSNSSVPFPGDSGIFNSTKLIPLDASIDLDVEYDFLNAKVTITNKAGVSGDFLGGLAEWDHGSGREGSRRFSLGGELRATFVTELTYNDSSLRWEFEKMDVNIVGGASFRVEFKYNVPADVIFGGVLLSGYAVVELEGGVQIIVNTSIPNLSRINSISDLVTEVQSNLNLAIKGAVGAEVGYGLLSGDIFVRGRLDVNLPSWRTELTLSYGVDYGYLWFFSNENTLGEKTWTLYGGNQNRRMLGMLAAPKDINDELVYRSAPRGYLQNQKWVGKDEIIKDAYPDSSAKISAVDPKIGDMLMVYIGDDDKRSDNNRTSVYSSVYKDGTWSQPVQIDNDGTGDAYPSLAVDGDNIYASWLDMKEEMGTTSAMTEDDITRNVLGKMGLSIANYDITTNSWKEQINIKKEGIIKLPQISANDGKVMAVWVNNANMSLEGKLEQPDDLYYVYNDGSGWSEPKVFVTGATNVKEGKLYMHNGKGYYVFVTNTYSNEGIYKAYVTRFDGKSWSKPEELMDNSNEDSNPAIALYNGEPTAFWQNGGAICMVSLERTFVPQIIINSTQAEGILELDASSTESGVALAWIGAAAGEKRLYISTFDEESSSWTGGTNIDFDSMEIPKGISLAGLGDSVIVVYNKTQYKFDEDNKIYYKDNTSLTSTSYVRKADLSILENGVYFENEDPLPGEDTKVVASVKNVGDITVKGVKVYLYESDKLIAVKDMPQEVLSPGNSVLADFSWKVAEGASGYKLKAVVETLGDSNPLNDTAILEKSYTDAEITGVYNELSSKNSGTVFVDVKNSGYSSLDSAKVYIATDKEFNNIIAQKEIKDIAPLMDKKVALQFKPTDEQIENRAKVYAKVEVVEDEFDYSNNIDFTVIRPMEDPDGTGIIEYEDTTPTPTPTPTTPTPTPTPGQNQNNTNPGQIPGSSDQGGAENGNTQDGNNSSDNNDLPNEENPGNESKDNDEETPDKPVIDVPTPEVPSTGDKGKKNVPYMKGFADKTFRPDKGLTRAEMAVIIANLDGVSQAQNQTQNSAFKDVKNNHWAAWAISYVTEKGIFNGYTDKTYRPDNYITRAELSVVLCKYINLKASGNNDLELKDIDGHWAKEYIMTLVSEGYIKGYPDGTFKPSNNVKRSECVAIINRILEIEPLMDSEPSFIDVSKKHWAFGDIMAATSTK